MAKLSYEKIVQKVDHRWRYPLVQKEDMTRPVIEGWTGEPFYHFPNSVLVPSASSSASSRSPVTPKLAPLPLEPEVDLMNFDRCHYSSQMSSLFASPIKDQNLCLAFTCQTGHFGIRVVHLNAQNCSSHKIQ
jgi:hypothetical protein